ncbi:hypothetical protein [Geoglobus ahangari]
MDELRFEDLLAEPKEFEFRGKKVRIPPLKVKDLKLFMDVSDPEKRVDALVQIFVKTMKEIFPERSEEEIRELPATVALEFFNMIVEANNLQTEVGDEDFQEAMTRLKSSG